MTWWPDAIGDLKKKKNKKRKDPPTIFGGDSKKVKSDAAPTDDARETSVDDKGEESSGNEQEDFAEQVLQGTMRKTGLPWHGAMMKMLQVMMKRMPESDLPTNPEPPVEEKISSSSSSSSPNLRSSRHACASNCKRTLCIRTVEDGSRCGRCKRCHSRLGVMHEYVDSSMLRAAKNATAKLARNQLELKVEALQSELAREKAKNSRDRFTDGLRPEDII